MKKIFLFLAICVNAFAFRLENITFNKSLKDGYREYTVYNDGTQRTRYKLKLAPGEEKDITNCLEVFPKIITVEPKGSQVFKIFGKATEKLEDREYKFYLNFEQIIIPTLGKADGKTVSGTSIMPLAPSIQMKGYGGEIDYSKSLSFENINFSKDKNGNLQVKGDVVNNSHGAVEVGLNFHNNDKTVGSSKGIGEVAAHSRKKVTIPLGSFKDKDEIKHLTLYNDNFDILKEIELNNGVIVKDASKQ